MLYFDYAFFKHKKKTPNVISCSFIIFIIVNTMVKSSSSRHVSYQSIPQIKKEVTSFDDNELEWTQEEENEVLQIIDKYLMMFILLMTFVLNMDRTNICKYFQDFVDGM